MGNPEARYIHYHYGIGPQQTILIMVLGEPNSVIVVCMDPLGKAGFISSTAGFRVVAGHVFSGRARPQGGPS